METKSNRTFGIVYLILLILFLIRFIPLLYPEGRFWAFNHLIFLPDSYTIIYAVIALIALAIPLLKQSTSLGESIIDSFSDIFYESKLKYLYRGLFVVVMGALFIIFAAPTHFLGDGYTALANLASDSGTVLRWSEKGITFLHSMVQSLLGEKNVQSSLLTFQITAIFSGMISIWFFFSIAGIVDKNRTRRYFVFIVSFLSAILLLFFGYVENYPLVWVALTGFIYFSLRYLKSNRGLVFCLIFLFFGLFTHLQMGILIPPFIYLILSTDSGQFFIRKHRLFFIISMIVLIIAGIAVFVYKYRTDLYFEDIFLPLFSGKNLSTTNFVFSATHIIDILNELLILSPLLPVLAAISFGEYKSILKRRTSIYFTILAVSGFLFTLIIDPKLGMGRDWDLFSFVGFGFALLFAYLITNSRLTEIKKIIPTITIYLIVAIVPYLMTNLNRDSSINYAKYLIDLDPEKSYSNLVIMRLYYQESGDTHAADSLQAVFFERFPNEKRIYEAFTLLKNGDINGAKNIAEDIVPDRLSGHYYNFLSAMYMVEGKLDDALEESDKAIQLGMYNYRFYINRALIFTRMRQYDRAIEAARNANDIYRNDNDVLSALAWIYSLSNQFDSSIVYSHKFITLDSANVAGYYFLSRAYIQKQMPDSSLKYFNLYQRMGHLDNYYDNKVSELQQMLAKLLK